MSSVDDADYTTGQIVVAQTLYQQLSSGRPGNYGSLPGASAAPGPSPAPTTSATASAKHADRPRPAPPGAKAGSQHPVSSR